MILRIIDNNVEVVMVKKIIEFIIQIGVLYLFFMLGRLIKSVFNLMIPASILGMLLLFTALTLGVVKLSWIEKGAEFMMRHLVFFFIPPTVGVMNYFDLFAGKGILLILIPVLSTFLVMLVSGHLAQLLTRLTNRGEEL